MTGIFNPCPILACAVLVACSTPPAKPPSAPAVARDTPIGEILRKYATRRSEQECKAQNLSPEECKQKLDEAEKHLASVNARIEALLKDPRTNQCDMVKFLGACEDPGNTLGDLADCLQLTPDRGEAINSGQVAFNLDSRGCPTSNKPIALPPELSGMWSIDGTSLHPNELPMADTIYLDSDGVGAFVVSRNGASAMHVRIFVTMYNADIGSVAVSLTQDDKTLGNENLMFDREHAVLTMNGVTYHRHAEVVPPTTRQELGLEPRAP